MIVPMKKVFIASHKNDRDALLAAVGELGVLHIVPVDPKAAVAEERTVAAIDHAGRALQILAAHKHDVGDSPEAHGLSPAEAVEEVLRIQREQAERQNRLITLYNKVHELDIWGDVRLDQFDTLEAQGLHVTLVSATPDALPTIEAEFVQPLSDTSKKLVLAAVLRRSDDQTFPEDVEIVERPEADRPTLQAEAKAIEAALLHDEKELAALVPAIAAIETYLEGLRSRAEYTTAARSSTESDMLLALQGWVPADSADSLGANLEKQGLHVAVQSFEPTEDDNPPTLVRYARWARPIKAMFDFLGTIAGYREIEISGFFLVALAIFSAMLIGDGGYGLLLLVAPLLMYRKAKAAGKDMAPFHLIMIFGVTTLIWGCLSGNFFGVAPQQIVDSNSWIAPLGTAMAALQVMPTGAVNQAELLIKISLICAVIHLCIAQLRQALAYAPGLKALCHIGWTLFLVGMFGLVWYLFFLSQGATPPPVSPVVLWLLASGAVLAILFANPSKNLLKMFGAGVGEFPMTAISTFSDTLSYIRLMAVGLASGIIALTFNTLALQVADGALWRWLPASMILLFGHGLNFALCMIAILAHGVRLNILEFSNNVGVSWSGYTFAPFGKKYGQE